MLAIQKAVQAFASQLVPLSDPSVNDAPYRFSGDRAVDTDSLMAWRRALASHAAQFDAGYSLMEDAESRAVYVESLVFRMVGWTKMVRRRNTAGYRAHAALASTGDDVWRVEAQAVAAVNGRPLHLYRSAGGVEMVASEAMFINLHVNGQYSVRRPHFTFEALPGDTVIDCGGCFGDTALRFAELVGPGGQVVCFEFVESNLDILQDNLSRNPALAGAVRLVRAPVGSEDGREVLGCDIGPASRLVPNLVGSSLAFNRPVRTYTTRTIDSVCLDELKLGRVDVIKMDIEGAEGDALLGAREVIRRFRPRLAISAYHRVDDFFRLPAIIRSIDPGYRFWMDHHTIHEEETVLYCVSREG